MALQVVKFAVMFTGAEAGISSTKMLTTTQLDALIEPQWLASAMTLHMENGEQYRRNICIGSQVYISRLLNPKQMTA